jgi:sulfatase maturation enzyme AslB (radical SAM superfamily)
MTKKYNWKDRVPQRIKISDLREDQQHRLINSDYFCILPWIHLHAWPDGRAFPCCASEYQHHIGNLKQNSLQEIWNSNPMQQLRKNMLNDAPCKECNRCYEQESAGFSSMRNNMNKNFGHYINLVDNTLEDGTLPDMILYYWDVRFSNICNLKCRSCGSIFSSRWYDDDVKLNGKPLRPRVQFAGKTGGDVWTQMEPHIQYMEQIYFAGGEPLIMEEHTRILKKLIDTNNTKVRLIYNTNLTELRFKKENVIDLWKHFPSVCVAASLDDMKDRAAIIRSGTDWNKIEQNIREIKQECPHVDFMISPTLSVMNIWNICEFHRYMVDQGFILPGDLNVNILQSPQEYRIDILPQHIKQRLSDKIQQHLEWLRPLDSMERATGGFEAAINFMMLQDRTDLLPDMWRAFCDLDWSRNENIVEVIPELSELLSFKPAGTRT